jgi:hypothetical protein
MALLETLGAKIVGAGIGNVASGVAEAIDRFVQTKEEKEAAAQLFMKIQQEPDRWQAEINKIEASHRSLFVAGWRPAIGWICALALVWGWVAAPLAEFVLRILEIDVGELPAVEVGEAVSLVMAMLGMGALRTWEKFRGVSK